MRKRETCWASRRRFARTCPTVGQVWDRTGPGGVEQGGPGARDAPCYEQHGGSHDRRHQDLPPADFAAALMQSGLPKGYADVLADSDEGIARGDLNDTSRTLSRLIGRPTTTLAEALAATLQRA